MSKDHYVCDSCGTYWNSTGEFGPYSFCIRCGGIKLSRFPRPIAALEHAAHIKERRAHAQRLEDSQTTKGMAAS